MSRAFLSKSRYIYGLQCLKLLWVSVNDGKRLPKPDFSTRHVLDEGQKVGRMAKRCFPGGIDIPTGSVSENLKLTKEALSQGRTLFEAGFIYKSIYCRVDILKPNWNDTWDIVEVKSSTSVKKDEHLADVAFQRHTCLMAGLQIAHCYVMHINKEFVRDGEIYPESFFEIEDVTALLPDYLAGIEERIENMLKCLDGEEPGSELGRRCEIPRECPLSCECRSALPDHHVMTLYWGGTLSEKLLRQGVLSIADIPEEERLNGKQEIQRECVVSGRPYCNRAEIKGFLKQLEYPLHFLDFETFRMAVPIYDGTRPYQQITFQFSLHVCTHDGDDGKHYSYLADGQDDPRPGLLAELRERLEPSGSIVAYNKTFEEERLNESAAAFPSEKWWIESAVTRFMDLAAPFKGFLYYHPQQYGSWSQKKVLPALTGISYEGLDIGDGETASLKYVDSVFGNLPESARAKIRADLETYCGQDTRGMVEIVRALRGLV
jgi:hypothetical protein